MENKKRWQQTVQNKHGETPLFCIAEFTDEEIAPLFRDAIDIENVILPKVFVDIIEN